LPITRRVTAQLMGEGDMDDLGADALKYVARIYADHGPAIRRILFKTAMEQIEDLPGMMPSVLAEISGVIACADGDCRGPR
jgi:hypothetical protein